MKRVTAEKTRESADMKSMRWELQVQTARADEFLERLAMYEPDVITTWTGGDDDEADIEPSPEAATIIFTSPSSEFITGELQGPSVGCLHSSFCHDLREQDEAALEKVMKAVAKAAKAAAAKAANPPKPRAKARRKDDPLEAPPLIDAPVVLAPAASGRSTRSKGAAEAA